MSPARSGLQSLQTKLILSEKDIFEAVADSLREMGYSIREDGWKLSPPLHDPRAPLGADNNQGYTLEVTVDDIKG
jgi:hypothetical protein